MSTLILDRDIPILTFLFLRESLRNWLLHCVPYCQICPHHFILLLILWVPLSIQLVYSPHDWLLRVPTNLFPSIWVHSFSLLLQLYCTVRQTVCFQGGFTPSFFYANIHPLPQSTFLSSSLRVQCILYIENIPCQVMVSSFKVRHQATPPPPPTVRKSRDVDDSVK